MTAGDPRIYVRGQQINLDRTTKGEFGTLAIEVVRRICRLLARVRRLAPQVPDVKTDVLEPSERSKKGDQHLIRRLQAECDDTEDSGTVVATRERQRRWTGTGAKVRGRGAGACDDNTSRR